MMGFNKALSNWSVSALEVETTYLAIQPAVALNKHGLRPVNQSSASLSRAVQAQPNGALWRGVVNFGIDAVAIGPFPPESGQQGGMLRRNREIRPLRESEDCQPREHRVWA